MIKRIFRQAEIEDIDVLERLESLSFPGDAWSRSMLLDEIENPLAFFCVLEETKIEFPADSAKGEIIAYIIAWLIEPFECQIGSIAVRPDKRRQHIASELLDTLFEVCIELSINEISLEVRTSNQAAIELYQKYGFKINGTRKNYYKDGEDAYNMVCSGLTELALMESSLLVN